VHIAGAVRNPGVYTLPPGSRVIDLIIAAGGLLPEADADAINQAARLLDGQKVIVPQKEPSSGIENSQQLSPQYPLNLNLATQKELENLPGIGPTKARDIINYREKHNYFKSVDELLNVPGIGPDTLEQIRELVSVQ
jgi:competence protein ComEA